MIYTKMANYAKLAFFVVLLSTASTTYAQDLSDFTREFKDEIYLAFVLDPPESKIIFQKYSKNFNREFTDILNNSNGYEDSLINDIILVSAINKNRALFGKINQVYKDHPTYYEQATRFYYFRNNHERDTNLNYLIGQFEALLNSPTDSVLIVYLPFLEDFDLSLRYLRKMSLKSDGAMSELVGWSANYLYYIYQSDKIALDKIKDSTIYHKFIKNK